MLAFLPLLLSLGPFPGGAPAPEDEPLLTLWIEDAASCFADPKDARLLAALRHVDDRVLEFPGELPGFPPIPAEAVRLAAHALTGRKTLRVSASEAPSAELPFDGQLELLEGDATRADALASSLLDLLRSAGAPLGERDANGLVRVQGGGATPVRVGARGSSLVVSVGRPMAPAEVPVLGGLPEGAQPLLSLHLDVARALDVLEAWSEAHAPREEAAGEGAQLPGWLAAFVGGDTVLDLVVGADRAGTITVSRQRGWASQAKERGRLPARGLALADVALVPADATWAYVGTVDAGGLLDALLEAGAEPLAELGWEDPPADLARATGFHLRTDLVDHLGPVVGLYASDTSGGGGMLSTVAFFELADPDAFRTSLAKLRDSLDGWGRATGKGYARTRTWEQAGAQFVSLVFPGLPVPIEPTLVVAAHHLVVGITPQAALAAVTHMGSGSQGLLANEGFRTGLPAGVDGAQAVTWSDTPRLVRDGYGPTSLLCSALSNGTRSPRDPERGVDVILPAYHDLVRGVRPAVGIARVVGDDLVTEVRSDRSLLVHVAGELGSPRLSPAVGVVSLGLVATLVAPNVVGSMREAKKARALADLRALDQAIESYRIRNGGRCPGSLADLVARDANGHAYLRSTTVPRDPWGNEYRYDPPASGGDSYRIYTYGADGVPGGSGPDGDLDQTLLDHD